VNDDKIWFPKTTNHTKFLFRNSFAFSGMIVSQKPVIVFHAKREINDVMTQMYIRDTVTGNAISRANSRVTNL
jgi:hypothetical protein